MYIKPIRQIIETRSSDERNCSTCCKSCCSSLICCCTCSVDESLQRDLSLETDLRNSVAMTTTKTSVDNSLNVLNIPPAPTTDEIINSLQRESGKRLGVLHEHAVMDGSKTSHSTSKIKDGDDQSVTATADLDDESQVNVSQNHGRNEPDIEVVMRKSETEISTVLSKWQKDGQELATMSNNMSGKNSNRSRGNTGGTF